MSSPVGSLPFAVCSKLWPELEVICSSRPQSLMDYFRSIGYEDKVLKMVVGDTQRIPPEGTARCLRHESARDRG